MHGHSRLLVVLLSITVAAVAGATEPSPPKNAPDDPLPEAIASWTVDGGGGYAAGGDLEVEATIGQPDAGLRAGGGMVLDGGFWGRFVDDGTVFADGFETGDTGRWSGTTGGTP
jgi:hypothetical protein